MASASVWRALSCDDVVFQTEATNRDERTSQSVGLIFFLRVIFVFFLYTSRASDRMRFDLDQPLYSQEIVIVDQGTRYERSETRKSSSSRKGERSVNYRKGC